MPEKRKKFCYRCKYYIEARKGKYKNCSVDLCKKYNYEPCFEHNDYWCTSYTEKLIVKLLRLINIDY